MIGSDCVMRERKFLLFLNVSERCREGRDERLILFPLISTHTLLTLYLGTIDNEGTNESTTQRHIANTNKI